MTVYHVSIGSKEYTVDVGGPQPSINGEPVDADLVALNESGLFLLRRQGRGRELHLRALGEQGYAILLNNGRHVIARVERATRRMRQRIEPAGAADLKAPMPGVIIQVCVVPGQVVEAGDTLLVMESMKMQMRLRAAQAGRVANILTEAQAQVEKGVTLVQLEPS